NSICAPSRAVILTGKYSHLNGVIDNRVTFDGGQQTLPKLLQQAGYQTAIVGKWHLKSPPTGFHYSNVLPGQGAYHNPVMIENGDSRKQKGYVTDLITDSAISWLRKQESSETPFFLMLHHKAPHADWEPDEKHMTMYSDGDIPLPATFNDDYITRTAQIGNHRLHVGPKQWELHFKRFGQIPEGMTEQQTREWVYQRYMKNYLACIASVDDNVGRVLDYLEQAGLVENTIVVYTSDQGFFLGDHGLYDKRFMYEHSLRMPLLTRYPANIKPGSVSDAMVSNLDFASTLLDYARVPVPEDIQGESFKSIANGSRPKDWRTAIYYRFYETAFGIGPHEGIRTKRHKLIHFLYGDMGWELYDLKRDPDELNNMYGSAQTEGLVEDLKEMLASLKRKYKAIQ
ncbi:MAG: sulfatase family protein, partial [Planctomycetota bacterium]